MKGFERVLTVLLVISLGSAFGCGEGSTVRSNNRTANNTNNTNNTNNSNNAAFTGEMLIKDLSEAQTTAVCHADGAAFDALYDVSTPSGRSSCLVSAALNAVFDAEDEDTDASKAAACQGYFDDCMADDEDPLVSDDCFSVEAQESCAATVNELTACREARISFDRAQLAGFNSESCASLTTEEGFEKIAVLFEETEEPAACASLGDQCPGLY